MEIKRRAPTYDSVKQTTNIVADDVAELYLNQYLKLFDISISKCLDTDYCKCIPKIPTIEKAFLRDQKGEYKLYSETINIHPKLVRMKQEKTK